MVESDKHLLYRDGKIPASALAEIVHLGSGIEAAPSLMEALLAMGDQPIHLTPPRPACSDLRTWEVRLTNRQRKGRDRLEVIGAQHFIDSLRERNEDVRHFFFDQDGYLFHGVVNSAATELIDTFRLKNLDGV